LHGIFAPGANLLLVVLLPAWAGATLFHYIVTRRAERKIKATFSRYLSPAMVRLLAEQPEFAVLGGEKLMATALFTDIKGFTALTEHMPGEAVAAMLNAYFSRMMDIVFANDGTLMKFIGDAAFVVWGAPVKIEDHARRAVQTALRIEDELKDYDCGGIFPALTTRVGIHTGLMVVGNLGSARRLDYTAVGDAVNLASRLESLYKYFGTTILMSGRCVEAAGCEAEAFELGLVRVAGKSEPVQLYTLFKEAPPAGAREEWQKALDLFRRREWEQAERLFTRAAELDRRLCQAADLYRQEIAAGLERPAAADWTGELAISTK